MAPENQNKVGGDNSVTSAHTYTHTPTLLSLQSKALCSLHRIVSLTERVIELPTSSLPQPSSLSLPPSALAYLDPAALPDFHLHHHHNNLPHHHRPATARQPRPPTPPKAMPTSFD
ncbi:hypothetical protein CC78DRAFT_587221 [Lojkania enalia]|uniref:Uncharacterized protein n=1 Tax=Lojkania enalia TaxID=147567 RepID=A0A9P4MXL1_9PLEO|nr:hypothetical protein CC78DRAFT_587221 [Didymosphaeria enalia]